MKDIVPGRPDKIKHSCISRVTVIDVAKLEHVEKLFPVTTPADRCIGYPREVEFRYRIGERQSN